MLFGDGNVYFIDTVAFVVSLIPVAALAAVIAASIIEARKRSR